MNRRHFVLSTIAATAALPIRATPWLSVADAETLEPGVAVLLVDTDRKTAPIDRNIYGQFLEHINHSVEDGLYAEQIQGAGFEGDDFKTYWKPSSEKGHVELIDLEFQNGKKSVRLTAQGGHASIRQGRIFLEQGSRYEGSLWVKRERGSSHLTLRVLGHAGEQIASLPIAVTGSEWKELPFSFTSTVRDTQASIELTASGNGSILVDFISMMSAAARANGMFRHDLYSAFNDLKPAFIRWPGGSFASTYRWKEGIGRYAARGYHPNTYWGGYSDYFGFGTDEFLSLCKKLKAEPLITLPATSTKPEDVQYAIDWIHYVNDPPTTEMGKLRAANGHPEPYNVKLFQIDNEPMNNGFTPDAYAEIVNVYGPRIRAAAPSAKVVACGQKRSNDMEWSEKVIDLAGKNFDVLGCHNYEYEPDNFETGVRRIHEYLVKLRDHVHNSDHPKIEIAVLEWSLQHTYDWRAGLHAAGSLMMYESLSPALSMTCPALLMRNITDDPTWTSSIYHDHVSWFPGGSYPVEKLFSDCYAERFLASTSGTFRDQPNRAILFDKISTAIPKGWIPGSVDAVATASEDNRRMVIKAVNYRGVKADLLVRLQGARTPKNATAVLHTITAAPTAAASIENPNAILTETKSFPYTSEFTINLAPYTVAVLEITGSAA
ncbi:alpha-L-arabinofuranosidase [Terriglobus roseus DSM 18391]|uniref:non-reducing end alpha-L-arabinofuranosidase n=1 Tax=Terriglobus roseus (strain DSM 18391 / NRRL B-41598 / KBS 63) TaxID=926566 RepID=I3ZFR5_TERRK|nr:carbohydrate binding domain-containing protein [Terriglobus roseus]AFL88083.1 alpha-L-arabinofuranosidase [Terriglobus roseus DSM 18391]